MLPFGLSATDDDQLVHNAARQGHAISLEIYLNQSPDSLNKIFAYGQSKWTPLLAACFHRHQNIVRMLLTRFKPDTEVVGTIILDLPNISRQGVECVTALWVAAAVNDFDIVKLLVEHGQANVNSSTETHSTAFRAACYNGNLEIAQYLVKHGANPYEKKKGNYTNLMLGVYHRHVHIVTYLVDELRSDVNEQDEYGRTALYFAVEEGTLVIAKYLLENGAVNVRDQSRKLLPLMQAALFVEIRLVDAFEGYCSDIEWIEAKELLGATFAGCARSTENLARTVEYLTQAFELRAMKNLPKVISSEPIDLFDYRRECETLEQFNDRLNSGSSENLHIEAILIYERLLGGANIDYRDLLRYHGDILASTQQYHRGLRFWLYELDLRRQYDINFQKEDLRGFVDLFNKIMSNGHMNIPGDALVQVMTVVHDELASRQPDDIDYNLFTLLFLITITARILSDNSADKNEEVSGDHRRMLLKLVRSINRCHYTTTEKGSSLLHLCLDYYTTFQMTSMSYPCLMTARLLISCGANVDAMDSQRNTPLHRLVRFKSFDVSAIIDFLCDVAGAHLDCVNNEGKVPLDTVMRCNTDVIRQLKQKMDVSRLKCLCARLIRQKELAYNENLSIALINFVRKH